MSGQLKGRESYPAGQLVKELLETTQEPFRLTKRKIEGEIDLRFRQIHRSIELIDCEFTDIVDVRNAHFMGTVNLSHCEFNKLFNSGDQELSHTCYDADLVCCHATFAGSAWFVGLRCKGSGLFQDCHFNQPGQDMSDGKLPAPVDFSGATFDKNASLDGTVFKGQAHFNAFKCGRDGSFQRVMFDYTAPLPPTPNRKPEAEVQFVGASFGVFCYMNESIFLGNADFNHSHFGWALVIDGSRFHQNTSFNGMRCDGGGFFRDVIFNGEMNDFAFAKFGINLQLDGACCKHKMNLQSVVVGNKLVLRNATFHDGIDLQYAGMRGLTLNSNEAFPGPGKSRFHGCQFVDFSQEQDGPPGTTLIDENRKGWRGLVNAQDPEFFTRHLHLVLERCFRSQGLPRIADKIYFHGRCVEARYSHDENAAPDWSWRDTLLDWFSWALTGYGVKRWLLLLYMVLFVVLGFLVFLPDNALVPRDPNAGIEPGIGDVLGYSIGRFIPVVDLKLTEAWKPAKGWRQFYNAVHIAAGWILVPLFVAALTGLLKKDSKGEA